MRDITFKRKHVWDQIVEGRCVDCKLTFGKSFSNNKNDHLFLFNVSLAKTHKDR